MYRARETFDWDTYLDSGKPDTNLGGGDILNQRYDDSEKSAVKHRILADVNLSDLGITQSDVLSARIAMRGHDYINPVGLKAKWMRLKRAFREMTVTWYIFAGLSAAFQWDDSANQFVDNTAGANSAAGTTFILLEEAVDDYFYFGVDAAGHGQAGFYTIAFVLNPVASITMSLVWEYWNGSNWISFTPTDGTSGWTASGDVTWTSGSVPNWALTTVNGVEAYYIRVRTATTPGTWPKALCLAEMWATAGAEGTADRDTSVVSSEESWYVWGVGEHPIFTWEASALVKDALQNRSGRLKAILYETAFDTGENHVVGHDSMEAAYGWKPSVFICYGVGGQKKWAWVS